MTDIPAEEGSIIELVERDHAIVRSLLARFDTTATDEWPVAFRRLVEYLVRHEVAEQEVVYPRIRAALPELAKTIEESLEDEEALERHLVTMARLPVLSPEFRDAVGTLRDELDAHIAREDLVILPMLRSLGRVEDRELVRRYELARITAPPRPEAVVGEEEDPEGLFARLRHALRRDGARTEG